MRKKSARLTNGWFLKMPKQSLKPGDSVVRVAWTQVCGEVSVGTIAVRVCDHACDVHWERFQW